jgi:hypothetical protein
MNRLTHPRHAGRVGHRKIGTRFQRHLGNNFNLAAQVHQEGEIGNIDDFHAVNVSDCFDNLFAVLAGNCADGDVAHNVVGSGAYDVYGANVAAGLSNRYSYCTETSGARRNFDAQGQAVTCAGCSFHI